MIHSMGCGPASHGRSHRSNELESGHGNSVTKVPPTFESEMEKPMSETLQSEATVPSKGEVDPDAPTAESGKALVVEEPSQATLTSAVTLVSAAGAST